MLTHVLGRDLQVGDVLTYSRDTIVGLKKGSDTKCIEMTVEDRLTGKQRTVVHYDDLSISVIDTRSGSYKITGAQVTIDPSIGPLNTRATAALDKLYWMLKLAGLDGVDTLDGDSLWSSTSKDEDNKMMHVEIARAILTSQGYTERK